MNLRGHKTGIYAFWAAIACWMCNTTLYGGNVFSGDILVNEIMAQPENNTGLPQKQYVEILNTTESLVSLSNWSINNGTILDGFITAKGYALLCAMQDTGAFRGYGKVIGVLNWSALQPEGYVVLRSNDKILIDSLPYNKETYRDTIKQKGGWSLELTAPGYEGDCPKYLYWSAAADNLGGTPGKQNKTGFPEVTASAEYTMLNDTIWEINFKGPLASGIIENTANYRFDNGISITKAVATDANAGKVQIYLNSGLQKNKIYTLIIPQLDGCAGFVHKADTFEIVLTDLPQEGELVINEILSHPNAGGVQFVEIYNNSQKIFKVRDLVWVQADIVSGIEQQVLEMGNINSYILPNDFLVFTTDRGLLQSHYPAAVTDRCIDVSLPLLSEEKDHIQLRNSENKLIDAVLYSASWHSPLLVNTQGISLERSSYSGLSQDSKNWHSAAKDAGFATPGFQNSADSYNLESGVQVTPEIFSPDGDGIDDELRITYSFDEPGSMVNLYILQTDGRTVIKLADELAVPREGVFVWNGQDENGEKMPVNIYFIILERNTLDGKKILYKHKCGLASKL